MTVMRMQTLFSWMCLCAAVHAQGQTRTDAVDYPIGRYNAQVGMDAWQFSSDKPEKLLMMATNTHWRYRPVAPWGTFDGRLMLSSQAAVALKARTNQEMGSHVDELSADWAFSPSVGVKAGVLDYKTSWCRTYDIDSPWVRENDPFFVRSSVRVGLAAEPLVYRLMSIYPLAITVCKALRACTTPWRLTTTRGSFQI